jgi:hypothetical protein
MINNENSNPIVYNSSKTHYLELHYKLKLVYVYESKGNKLIQIVSIDELKQEIKGRS